jgi:hypothetical protein
MQIAESERLRTPRPFLEQRLESATSLRGPVVQRVHHVLSIGDRERFGKAHGIACGFLGAGAGMGPQRAGSVTHQRDAAFGERGA